MHKNLCIAQHITHQQDTMKSTAVFVLFIAILLLCAFGMHEAARVNTWRNVYSLCSGNDAFDADTRLDNVECYALADSVAFGK